MTESTPNTTSLPPRSSEFIADCACIWFAEMLEGSGDETYVHNDFLVEFNTLTQPLAKKVNNGLTPFGFLQSWGAVSSVNLDAPEKDIPFELFQIAVSQPALKLSKLDKPALDSLIEDIDADYLKKLEFYLEIAFPDPMEWFASRGQYLVSTTAPAEVPEEPHKLSGEPIPAANRYVSARDNQDVLEPLVSAVKELTEAVQNDRTNDFDEKEGALGELLVLELALAQPQISVPLVESIIKGTVKTLTTLFSGAAIGSLASDVIAAAKPLIGTLF